mmetsp:Transcript_26413/g.67197  ORF Transcript_26413/g.67197 Transcript_26413/m.67197 type:complete len:207 (+) Transcript_26413:2206-2826(+)
MSCSLWYALNTGCVRKGEVRAKGPTPACTEGASEAAVKGAALPPLSTLSSASTSASVVVSSMEMPTVLASITRRFMPCCSAVLATLAASPTVMATVSKKGAEGVPWPSFLAPAASTHARPLTRAAMVLRPSGPWYTAYSAAMLASSACAVQMLEVALSRRMCCSRVCIAMRSAGLPCASMDMPMMRPGIMRLYSSWHARNAACGPP